MVLLVRDASVSHAYDAVSIHCHSQMRWFCSKYVL